MIHHPPEADQAGTRVCYSQAEKEKKTKHNWVGDVIHWELYKKLKCDPTDK